MKAGYHQRAAWSMRVEPGEAAEKGSGASTQSFIYFVHKRRSDTSQKPCTQAGVYILSVFTPRRFMLPHS